MSFTPMLCDSLPFTVEALTAQTEHVFERKYDGIRAVVAISGSTVVITNRNGVDISYRYPDLVAALQRAYPSARLIFDGEIIGADGNFASVHRRDAQSDPHKVAGLVNLLPVEYVAFDLLYDASGDLRGQPWTVRRAALDAVADGSAARTSELFDDPATAMQAVTDGGWEGLVVKHRDASYQAGRRSGWRKAKPTHSGSFIVTGLEPGQGSRSDTFGAAYIGLKADDGFVTIGKVGSGFRDEDLRILRQLWSGVEAGLTPPPVIDVEYQERTVDGALRFPVFRGFRTDVSLDECTDEQFARA
jgi:bifunctional non-homologous end joining protein LigD